MIGRIVICVLVLTCAGAKLVAQEVKWTPAPSFRFGDVLRLDPRVKLQGDLLWYPSEIEPADGTFDMGRRRASVEGTLLDRIDFEVEYDFNGDGLWTDVYADARISRQLQVQGGKFKIPFSLEETTGAFSIDFVTRSVISRDLSPGRDKGGMVHGRWDAVSYEAGVFKQDGERSRFLENPGGDTTFAGRVRFEPLRGLQKDALLRSLQLGVALVMADVPEGPGPNSLRARTLAGSPIFYEVYVKGLRSRLGTEALWESGPFSVKGEFISVWESREGQGLAGDDLPTLNEGGWYASASWVLTGERKSGGVEPKRPIFDGGIGAFELAARYERVFFGADHPTEPEEANPRSANLVEVGSGATTLGVNWYLNRWGKIQFNAIREMFDDIERSPIPGRSSFWSGICRLQFVL